MGQLEMRSCQLEERERHQKALEANLLQKEMLEQQMQAVQEALKAKEQGRLRAHMRMYSHRGVGTEWEHADPKERKIFEAARAYSRGTEKKKKRAASSGTAKR